MISASRNTPRKTVSSPCSATSLVTAFLAIIEGIFIAANYPMTHASSGFGRWHSDVRFAAGNVFVPGPETRGLNISNVTSMIIYEGWRQLEFKGAV